MIQSLCFSINDITDSSQAIARKAVEEYLKKHNITNITDIKVQSKYDRFAEVLHFKFDVYFEKEMPC